MVVWFLYRFDSVNEVVCGSCLCRDLSVKGLRMLLKCFESWQVSIGRRPTE